MKKQFYILISMLFLAPIFAMKRPAEGAPEDEPTAKKIRTEQEEEKRKFVKLIDKNSGNSVLIDLEIFPFGKSQIEQEYGEFETSYLQELFPVFEVNYSYTVFHTFKDLLRVLYTAGLAELPGDQTMFFVTRIMSTKLKDVLNNPNQVADLVGLFDFFSFDRSDLIIKGILLPYAQMLASKKSLPAIATLPSGYDQELLLNIIT